MKESISIRACNSIYFVEFQGTLELCGRACGNQTASVLWTSAQCLGLACYLPRVAGPLLSSPRTALFFLQCFIVDCGP